MNVRTCVSRLAAGLMLLTAAAPLMAITYTAQSSGDFHTAANYTPTPTGPFTGADDIVVDAGVNLTLTQLGTTTVKSITFNAGGSSSIAVNSGATLSVTGTNANTFGIEFGDPGTGVSEMIANSGGTLSVSNTISLYGAAAGVSKLRSTGGTIQTAGVAFGGTNPLNGGIDLSSGSGTFHLTFGSLPTGGSISAGTGSTFKISGAATTQTFGGYTFHNLEINKSNGSAVLIAPIDVNGNLNVVLGTFATNGNTAVVDGTLMGSGAIDMTGGGDLRLSGDFINTGTFTAGTGTVKYEGGTGQTLRGTTYNILAVVNAGTNALMSGNVTTSGLLVDTGAFLGVSSFTLTVTGSAVVNNSIYSGGGTMSFTGAGGTISGTAGIIGPTTTIATRTINAGSNLNFLGSVNIANSSTVTNNGTVDIDVSLNGLDSSSTWVNATGSALTVGGNVFSSFGNLTAGASGNTVTYDGGNQSLFSTTYHDLILTSTIPAAKTYSAALLTVNGDLVISGQSTFTASSDITVGGSVTLGSVTTFNAATFNIAVGGDWNRNGTFTPGTSTVAFNSASAAQNISASPFWGVVFSGNGVKLLNGALDVDDDFSIGSGATVTSGAFTHNVAGTWSNVGTFNDGNSKVIFNPTSPITVDATTFYDLTVDGTASVTLSGNVNAGNDLQIAGDLQVNGFVLTVSGTTTVDAGTFLGVGTGTLTVLGDVVADGSITSNPGGTVKASGTANQNWSGTTAPAFENLSIDKPSGTITFDVTCFVSATLSLDGILDTNAIVNINSTGSIVRTSGWIDGRLSRATTGPGALLFPLGTTLGYAPVTATVASAGSLDVEILGGAQPNNTGSDLNQLQAYWSIPFSSVTGNVDLNFVWTAAMENGSPAGWVLGRYDGSAWSQPGGTLGAQTATISNVASYTGDWTAGDPASVGGATIFEVTGPATATAGGSVLVTITAKDGLGNVVTSYAGDKTILIEGASAAPDGTDPTATDKTSADIVFGNNTTITFTAGVGTTTLKMYADETVFIEATETAGPGTPTPLSIVVSPAAATALAITNVTFLSTPYANAPFDVEITALDPYENAAPVATNTVVALNLSNCGGCTGTLGGSNSVTLFAGAATDSVFGVTYSAADTGVVLTATRTSGDVLTDGNSTPITFAAQVAGIVVTTDADSGAGSLREALTRNNSGECVSPCAVTFNITPSGAHEIVLTSDLPTISMPVSLDATSQPGYTGTPVIAIDGSGATSNGLNVETDDVAIKGFILHSFTGSGIELDTVTNATIQGNWIGTDLTGSGGAGNLVGIYLTDSTNVLIGGPNAGEGNVISANTFAGIDVNGNSSSNTVAGNYIGTNAAGTAALPNNIGLSLVDSASNNTIGGSTAGHRNVISGNATFGVFLEGDAPPSFASAKSESDDVHAQPLIGSNVNANAFKNNYIGTNAAGSAAIPNGIGINVEGYSTANAVGESGNGNVISGNTGPGIVIDGAGNNDNFIRANLIGVAADGVSALGNGGDGIEVLIASDTLVGGTGGGDANTIAHNAGNGVTVTTGQGVEIVSNSIHSNTGRGIDLGDDGADTQDDGAGDADTGANGKQNYPVIGSASIAAGNLSIAVTMSSSFATVVPTALRVQFFEADTAGSGEGKTSLAIGPCLAGSTLGSTITVPAGSVAVGDPVVATATSYSDTGCTTVSEGTSEFSPAVAAAACTPPAATITAGGPTTFCTGGSVVLTASAGASWLWSNGATTQSITVTTSGSHSVTVTDGSGCSATSAATTVTVNPIPTATVTASGPTTFCTGGSVVLTANLSDSYLWSTGATTQSITVTAGGSYSVQVTQSGCTSASSTPVVVTVNPTPAAIITPSGPTTFCTGGSVILTASNGDSWLWSTGATTQSITVTASGSYSVQVTQNGCSATSAATSVTVNPIPTATITPSGPTTFCTGGSVVLTANLSDSYLWSTGATTQSITVTTGGSYSVQVTQNGCTSASSTLTAVTVNPTPTATITASGPTTFCTGGSVILTANTSDSYLWSTGATTQSITVTAGGSYSVQVTQNGCTSASSTPVVVTVNPVPTATITASGLTTFCTGGSVVLTANTSDSYLWSTGATTQSITVTTGGSYSVQVTQNGCTSAPSAPTTVTVNPTPTATITPGGPTTFCTGGSVILTANTSDSYLWSTGATTQSITVTTGGSYSVQVTQNGCTSASSTPVTVTVNPTPTATITPGGPTTFCTGGSVILTANTSDSYLWSTGATTQSITVTAGGSYSVQVTQNGCTSAPSAPTTVTVNATPTATITASGPTTFCTGGSVVLTANLSDSYLWSTGATTQSITVTAGGTYSVQVTQNGCTSASSTPVTVTVNPTPTATITPGGPTTFCTGGSVVLTANLSDSYLWSTGATTQSITVTTGGSYTVQVTQNGCTSAASAPTTVTVNPTPTATITPGGPTTFCTGGSVVLTANLSDSYLWSTGATTQSITVTTGGSYSVQVTQNGCTSASSTLTAVTVNPTPTATITASGPTTFCTGGSVILTANTSDSYLWSTGATTQSITVTAGGSYSVQVTQNGCTSASSTPVVVTVNPVPAATITPSGPTSFCAGGSVTLTASNGDSWLWSTGATTQSIVVSASGSYSVTVTAGGCSATSAATNVNVSPAPAATVNAGGPTTFCSGGSVELTASAGSSWLWSNGETTQTITVTTGGSYTVTVTDGVGCNATSAPMVVTVNPTPDATITGPASTCTGTSVTLTAGNGSSWLWSTGDTTQSITVTPSSTATYSVTVTSGSCSASDSHTVTVSSTPTATIAAPPTVCASSTGNAASVAAQTGASYTWTISGGTITGGAGTNAIAFTAGSTGSVLLAVTVVKGSCTSTGNATIPVGPAITQPNITATGTLECASSTVTLDAGAGYASYLWSTGATTQTITVNSAQTYSVTVSNGFCTATDSITISIPPGVAPQISAPSTAEPLSTHTATALPAGDAYSWAITNGTIVSGQGTGSITFTVGNSGTTGLSVVITRGACTLNAFHSITIGTAPPPEADLVVTKSGPSTASAGGTITYTIDVTNNGPNVATGLEIVDDLPAGTTLVSVQSGLRCTTSTTGVFCSGSGLIGPMSPIVVTVTAPSQPGTITNIARVSSAVIDPDPSNNRSSVTTTIGNANCGTPVAPIVISPSDGASGLTSPVTFSWTAVPQAIGYRLFASANGGTPQQLGETDGALTLAVAVPSGALTTFVEAIFGNGCPSSRSADVRITVNAPERCGNRPSATPTAPANNSTVNSSNVTFQWLAAANADGYRVWVSVDGGTPEVVGETLGETSLTATLSRGTILWWVEALYDGCASTESQRNTFTIPAAQQCSTEKPALIAPAAGADVPAGIVTFSWTASPNALSYELWLAHENGTPTLVRTVAAPATTVQHEVPAGALHWFVRVLADRCPPRESDSQRFEATQPSGCETNDRPLPRSPVDRDHVSSPVTFSWSGADGAAQYELFVAHGNQTPQLIATTAQTSVSGVQLSNGRKRWFVRALFGQACRPLDSAEQILEVVPQPAACSPLEAPVVFAPGQISSGLPFSILWTSIPGATTYQLQIADNPSFANAESIDTSATQHELLRTNNGATPLAVHVRVRAVDTRCNPAATSAFGATLLFMLPSSAANEGAASAGEGGTVTIPLVLGSELAGQTFVATPTQPWLTVTPSTGIVPPSGITLQVKADSSALPLGTSLGGVIITTNAAAGSRVVTQATSSTTPVSISIVTPVAPTPKNTPPPDALIIPAVAHADGINAKFQSDVRVSNTSPRLIKYQLTFTPSGDSGITQGRQTTFSVDPGRTVALDDILKSWFGTGSASVTGVLEVRPLTQTTTSTSSAAVSGLANLTTFASSRTYNITANGTYGQFIPAIPYANFVAKSAASGASVLSLQQIAHSDRFRTNLGFVEGSGQPASLLVTVFGSNGAKVTSFPVSLAGGQHLQLNSFLATQGITTLNDGRVEVQVTSSTGKVTAYASVLDNQTADPLLVTPVTLSEQGQTKWVVPGVADLANGLANWQTDMRIFNAGTEPVEATLSFHSQAGAEPVVKTLTIEAGKVQELDKTLASVFGRTNDGGAVHISTPKASRLIATARTYNLTSKGTYGQFISAVTAGEAAGVGSRPLQLLQLEESDRYRSNIGFAEVSGKPVTLEVGIVPPEGKTTAFIEVKLGANEFRQLNSLLGSVGLRDTHNARITVRAISGEGRAAAYASVVDMETQDPTYVPAQ